MMEEPANKMPMTTGSSSSGMIHIELPGRALVCVEGTVDAAQRAIETHGFRYHGAAWGVAVLNLGRGQGSFEGSALRNASCSTEDTYWVETKHIPHQRNFGILRP